MRVFLLTRENNVLAVGYGTCLEPLTKILYRMHILSYTSSRKGAIQSLDLSETELSRIEKDNSLLRFVDSRDLPVFSVRANLFRFCKTDMFPNKIYLKF